MDVIIIFLNWNKPELSRKAVDSVKIPPTINGQIILADSGSSDDSLEIFKGIPGIDVFPLTSFHPEIRISGWKHLDFGMKLSPETLFQRDSGYRGLPAAVCSHPGRPFPDEN
ncbi:MAG: hypothetical protein C0407_14160 [Desulfobacca sp.]|nr:hypothetical protein [Desulfobacca sp.]